MNEKITVFDHRGCSRGKPNSEYKGEKANDIEDEMLVKVPPQLVPAFVWALIEARACIFVQGKHHLAHLLWPKHAL
jgi:hypothetical protein